MAGIGQEVAIPHHLPDNQEFDIPLKHLLNFGKKLFVANWTVQEGQGRPLTKGTGNPLSNLSAPLDFPRNFNRISSPEANSCAGCHNAPIPGGSGDIVGNVFVLAQRFDWATFDANDLIHTSGAVDERGKPVTLPTIANSRATPGMFGSGYYEMLAREITADLRAIAANLKPGGTSALVSKGISFGQLGRFSDGTWDTSGVQGLPPQALVTLGPGSPPSLILQPWQQAGSVVSIRQFTNNAFVHHHGMESEERFGLNIDQDGDGFINELTRADITANSLFQASMAVPGRLIPSAPAYQAAILNGESLFKSIGCASCHIPSLPLKNWTYSEPNPYNPGGNLQVGQAMTYNMDLTDPDLPQPRLTPVNGVVNVPVYTDFKLHNICSGPNDPNSEALDQNQPLGSPAMFNGNQRFLTKRLWDVGSKPNHYHHGKYTTIRESILAHAGEALNSEQAFAALGTYDQGSVIEFLKSLQVLPPGTKHLAVNENGTPVQWPPQ